jgi:hypothetical protein
MRTSIPIAQSSKHQEKGQLATVLCPSDESPVPLLPRAKQVELRDAAKHLTVQKTPPPNIHTTKPYSDQMLALQRLRILSSNLSTGSRIFT